MDLKRKAEVVSRLHQPTAASKARQAANIGEGPNKRPRVEAPKIGNANGTNTAPGSVFGAPVAVRL